MLRHGVTVVTTLNSEQVHGLTVNSFTSVSLNPPLVLICIDKQAESHDYIAKSGVFTVSVLAEDQEQISRLFASDEMRETRSSSVGPRVSDRSAPIVNDCIAFLGCRVIAVHEAGDHTIFIGRVEATGRNDDCRQPLIFYKSECARLCK